MEKQISKDYINKILTDLRFYDFFKENYLNDFKTDLSIDYGNRIKTIEFSNFIDAGIKYRTTNNIYDENKFILWNKNLNNVDSSEELIFQIVVEIFDWGGVWNGNIKKAIELKENNELKKYILKIKELLNSDKLIEDKDAHILWSSGWTKVYSFINPNFIIYDSRVSSFLNYTLTSNINYSKEDMNTLNNILGKLFNFKGNNEKERIVKGNYTFSKGYPSGLNGFNANLVASWVLQLLKSNLKINEDIRLLERAFFMLGFDLKQIYNKL